MADVVLTGASRGIGRALALALPSSIRVHALARDVAALDELAAVRPNTIVYGVDLASRRDAASLGRSLAASLPSGLTLVHNAGLWPSRREEVDGLERAFVVNCVAPLELQRPLLDAGKVARILVIGAGLMVKGRFDATRTPAGDDFSWFRTYCSTKLAFAAAMREVARAHPEVDVAVVHPGVVRTALGARRGVLGWLVDRVKRRWESPEECATRLVALLGRDRWSVDGNAKWFFEAQEQPWPPIVDAAAPAVESALRATRLRD